MAYPQFPHATYDEFRNAVNGLYIDLDGEWGAQCWDGACLIYVQNNINQFLYTAHNINPQLSSAVRTCWTNLNARERNGSGHFSIVYNKEDIKKGDIVVLDTYTTGHIAYADEDYSGQNTMNFLGENQGAGSSSTVGKAFNIESLDLSNFMGAFRLDMWNQPVPPTPTGETKKRKFPFAVAWQHWW